MVKKIIDLRSDTITLPTQRLIDNMVTAEVGDYAYGDDKAYNELVDYCKDLFKVEDAIFVTSGMLANRLAIMAQTEPGDEVITDYSYHINFFDSAATAKVCGVVLNCVHSSDGILTYKLIEQAINTKPRYKTFAQVKLVTIENTINSSQGKIFPIITQKAIYEYLMKNNISLHLDGARIFNAHIATGIPLREYAKYTDTLSFCCSKGLGAPFGSMLLGKKDIIEKAKKYQTWLGSGYHQIGFQAKAALYALQNHIPRLNEDHKLTQLLFKKLSNIQGIKLLNKVETNMVGFDISSLQVSNNEFLDECAKSGVLLFPWLENQIRAVIHLGITETGVEYTSQVVDNAVQKLMNK
jgi:threonine aldolase